MKDQGLSKSQIAIMAVAAGACVANIYYNQPILKDIAASFGLKAGDIGIISALSQGGYGLGLFFLTPLGDKISRKRLILVLHILLVAALAGMTFTTSVMGLYAMSGLIGVLAIAAQVILPMAASLDKVTRGRTVGIIFTGILIGILFARVFSGFITQWLGWRYVYGLSAVIVLIMAVFIYFGLPDKRSDFTGHYGQLLRSTLLQMRRFSLLRRTALLGSLVFGTFSSFWTTLTFHLSGPPFHYRTDTIGLFGILAIAGALLAPLFGKLADKGNPARSQVLTVILIIVGILLLKFLPFSLLALIIAVLLLDIGVQATQVTNVAIIYTLDESANSRINTGYMTSYFIGGAIGTLAGVLSWKLGGWPVVTWQLLLWAVLALLVAVGGYRRRAV